MGPANLSVRVTILEQCVEGRVRLVGGRDGSAGRVELCHHGVYGTVCNETWTQQNTHVLCNQLGFYEGNIIFDV